LFTVFNVTFMWTIICTENIQVGYCTWNLFERRYVFIWKYVYVSWDVLIFDLVMSREALEISVSLCIISRATLEISVGVTIISKADAIVMQT